METNSLFEVCVQDEEVLARVSEALPNTARAKLYGLVANALQLRFEKTRSLDDLDRAIRENEKAVASTSADHLDHAIYLSNLGNLLRTRFEETGSMDDLNQAIVIAEQAVALTAEDNPNLGGLLNNLGLALQSRFKRTGSTDDLKGFGNE